jgi:hypothetical protein
MNHSPDPALILSVLLIIALVATVVSLVVR